MKPEVRRGEEKSFVKKRKRNVRQKEGEENSEKTSAMRKRKESKKLRTRQ